MWTGEKVHDCIQHTLTNLRRGIAVLDVDEIVSITINKMRDDFRASRDKRYHTYPKECALFEHEYDLDLSSDHWKQTADDVETCLRNFYGSEIFARLKELSLRDWLEVEDFSYFNLDGKKMLFLFTKKQNFLENGMMNSLTMQNKKIYSGFQHLMIKQQLIFLKNLELKPIR